MVSKKFHRDVLNELSSNDQIELLDSIDCLRSQGISHYVSLPQIIVCGDQSSGKSSVLEAISGVPFPTKSNLCTRFPIELVLRKTPQIGVSVSIVPHESRDDSEKLSLNGFREKLDDFDGLPALIEAAKTVLAISIHGRAFSKDILRVEVSGPDRPHLTIVDLPGLIHSETKQQSLSDVELVQDVVQTYMKEQRSIILAVVSAKNDYANQIVLKLARAADKSGRRTLGVITKPDTLIPNSESEGSYVSLAKNQDVEFRLGWHVLKNMDSETGEWTLADRNAKEGEFFSQGIWEDLPRSLLGIEKLRSRLSQVLLRQIAAELPSLIKEIEVKTTDCRKRLNKLGEPRATLEEQRIYLLHISQSFQSLVKASVDGTYNDSFFGDAQSEPGYQKRIRAVVQNLNTDFSDLITRRGHRREIKELSDDSLKTKSSPEGVIFTTRAQFMDHIEHLMKRTKGRELPGTFNPMIVADLFREQSVSWEAITREHIITVWKSTKEFLRFIAPYIADAATSKVLFQKIFEPALSQLLEGLNAQTTELLKPHQKSHPITYNQYFDETLDKVRSERALDRSTKILENFFVVDSLESVYFGGHRDLRPLATALSQRTEPDMNRIACSDALDCMEAYYKVALERFVDDVSVEVIETKLISLLHEIFSPITVISMPEKLVTSIAGESEESRTQREQLTKQLEVLTKGTETCERYVDVRILDADDSVVESERTPVSVKYDPSDYVEESNALKPLVDEFEGEGAQPVRVKKVRPVKVRYTTPSPPPPPVEGEYIPIVEEGLDNDFSHFVSSKKGKKDKKSKIASRISEMGIE